MTVELRGTKAQTITGFGYTDSLITMVIARLVKTQLAINCHVGG